MHYENIKIVDQNKYYVYALYRANGIPFYIGKGKGDRLRTHFKPYSMKIDSLKNTLIREHGGSKCARDIIAYFDNEGDALDLEEYLIEQYGIIYEGGVLANLMKNRYEYSKHLRHTACTTRSTVPESVTNEVYHMYYALGMTRTQVRIATGLGVSALNLYLKPNHIRSLAYFEAGGVNIREDRRQELPDALYRDMHARWLSGELSIVDITKLIGRSKSFIQSVFRGGKLKHLKLPQQDPLHNSRRPLVRREYSRVISLYKDGVTVIEIALETGVSKTQVVRLLKSEGIYAPNR